jgi:hypothetical protein
MRIPLSAGGTTTRIFIVVGPEEPVVGPEEPPSKPRREKQRITVKNRRFLVTSKRRHIYGVLNVDEMKN